MVGGIFKAFDGRGFPCLVSVSQFLDTLFGSIFNVRKTLHVAGLAGAARANLPWICSKLIEPGFVVTTWSGHHWIL
jgi:hypothetical protein